MNRCALLMLAFAMIPGLTAAPTVTSVLNAASYKDPRHKRLICHVG